MDHDLNQLEDFLRGRVKGQDFATQTIVSAVQRAEMGFSKAGRPKSVFLFLGPTGTGKTESTLNLGRFLYGSESAVARFDMGEYGHADSLKRLLGEDRNDPGLLGRAIDERPDGGILLLDEIEKADSKVSKVFLGATDAARTTSTDGKTRSLEKWYLVFTSNLGSAAAALMDGVPYATLKRTVMQAATQFFSPETMARFTNKVVFKTLAYDVQREIAGELVFQEGRHISNLVARRLGVPVSAEATPEAITFLIRRGYTREMGARPMRDAIEKYMGEATTKWLLRAEAQTNEMVHLHYHAAEAATELELTVSDLAPVVCTNP